MKAVEAQLDNPVILTKWSKALIDSYTHPFILLQCSNNTCMLGSLCSLRTERAVVDSNHEHKLGFSHVCGLCGGAILKPPL